VLPPWRRRVLAYRIIGGIPGGEQLLDWYRPRFGKLKMVDLEGRDKALGEMMRLVRGAGRTVEDKDLIEIGTGWHPLLPVLFHGLGARTVLMTDIVRHVRGELIEQVLDYCLGHSRQLAEIGGYDEDTLKARWSALRPGRRGWINVWRDRGITYRAPLDFSHSGLPAESADLIFSNDCLGYIPVPELEAITKESWRILRPGGFIAHDLFVYDDMEIHDRQIPHWNFLRYSAEEWDRIGNSRFHYQNRCRPGFYAKLAAENGLRILHEERVLYEMREEDLDRSILHPDFRALPFEEIACNHYLLAAEKPNVRGASPQPGPS
jgi:SAM-dependent methyltransferase